MNRSSTPLLLLALGLVGCEAASTPAPGLPTEDSMEVMRRYRDRYSERCNSWVQSPWTGKEYCASPSLGFDTAAAYEAAKPKAAGANPAFEGFDAKSPDEKKAVLVAEGEKVYAAQCAACHQPTGLGVPNAFPPLAGDPVANGGPVEEHITIVLNGLSGKVINGVSYSAAMTPYAATLNDEQIASVISYERNSWGNNGGIVEPAQVAALRK